GLEGHGLPRRVAELVAVERVETRRVEDRDVHAALLPLAFVLPARRQLLRVAAGRVVVRVVVPGERLSALPFEAARELPAAEERLRYAAPVGAPLAVLAEGQLGHAGEGDAVRTVHGRAAGLQPFPRVQGAHLLREARICVRRREHEALVEALLQPDVGPVVLIA